MKNGTESLQQPLRATIADDDVDAIESPSRQGTVAVRTHRTTTSSPSSPLPSAKKRPPKPPRMRSMLYDDTTVMMTSQVSTVVRRQRRLSTGSRGTDIADSGLNPAVDRHPDIEITSPVNAALIRLGTEILVASGLQPEVVADFLRRRGAIGDSAVTAVVQAAGRVDGSTAVRRWACELIVEVVAARGRPEIAMLAEAMKAAGPAGHADCLAAVDGLVSMISKATSLTTAPKNIAENWYYYY